MITTCPSALKSLISKAELLGAHTDYRIDQQHRNGSVAFNIDFVNHYLGIILKIFNFCIDLFLFYLTTFF